MRIITRIINFVILVILVYFGINFYQSYDKLKESGLETNKAAKIAAQDAGKKLVPVFGQIFDLAKRGVEKIKDHKKDDVSSRELFIEERGVPEVFMLMYSDADMDESGVISARDRVRRVETWIYGGEINKQVIFDNSYFVSEEDVENNDYKNHNLNPLALTRDTDKESIKEILGNSSCSKSFSAGKDSITTIYYKESDNFPVASFSFINDKLMAATVGIVFTEKGEICK